MRLVLLVVLRWLRCWVRGFVRRVALLRMCVSLAAPPRRSVASRPCLLRHCLLVELLLVLLLGDALLLVRSLLRWHLHLHLPLLLHLLLLHLLLLLLLHLLLLLLLALLLRRLALHQVVTLRHLLHLLLHLPVGFRLQLRSALPRGPFVLPPALLEDLLVMALVLPPLLLLLLLEPLLVPLRILAPLLRLLPLLPLLHA